MKCWVKSPLLSVGCLIRSVTVALLTSIFGFNVFGLFTLAIGKGFAMGCLVLTKRHWLNGKCVRLFISRSQVRISEVAEFLLIRGLILNFIIVLYRAAFCRVLASVCEAKVCLYVEIFFLCWL